MPLVMTPMKMTPTSVFQTLPDPPDQQVFHQCLLHVHAILGLVPHDRLRAVDNLGFHFLPRCAGRQCMNSASACAAAIISRPTHQSAKALRRASFSASKPMLVHTSVVTR